MTNTLNTTRIERDCLGEMEIPNDCYWGIQTHRMVKVSGCAHLPVIFHPGLHRALFTIKKACAMANAEIGALEADVADAIVKACDRAARRANSTANSRSTCGREAATRAST